MASLFFYSAPGGNGDGGGTGLRRPGPPGPRHMPFRPSREWRPGAYQAAERDARAPTRTHNSRAHEFKTHSTRFTEHGSQSTGHGS